MGEARPAEVRRVFRPILDHNHAVTYESAKSYEGDFALEDLCLVPR